MGETGQVFENRSGLFDLGDKYSRETRVAVLLGDSQRV
jgi:hypothetical protein